MPLLNMGGMILNIIEWKVAQIIFDNRFYRVTEFSKHKQKYPETHLDLSQTSIIEIFW